MDEKPGRGPRRLFPRDWRDRNLTLMAAACALSIAAVALESQGVAYWPLRLSEAATALALIASAIATRRVP